MKKFEEMYERLLKLLADLRNPKKDGQQELPFDEAGSNEEV